MLNLKERQLEKLLQIFETEQEQALQAYGPIKRYLESTMKFLRESGKNLEFETGKKIVQQWYFGDQEEKSIVSLILHPHKQGTSVELRHTNIPDEAYEDIVEGWNETYFRSLEDFYDE